MLASKARQEAGFTIVELLVVMSVLGVIGIMFLGLASSYLTTINHNNQLTEMTVASQNLLRTTVENIRYGDGIRQTNQNNDPNAPVGGWNTSNTNFVIIVAVPALDNSKAYIIDPDTGNPYMNELVYYKSGTTLLERKLANPNATGTTLKTTCPVNLASNSCSADTVLADSFKSMSFTLYDQDDNITVQPSLARSISIDLAMERNSKSNKPIQLNTKTRVTLRNRF